MRTRRQRLGQHYLGDEGVAGAIAEALPGEPARVIEIGPGRGALTVHLLRRFPRVRAVEIDPRLAATLPGRLGRPPGLEVLHADALDVAVDELARDGPWLVAGNLPYSVGTAILRRLLPRGDLFPGLVVMVQKEVAERLLAPPSSAARGLLSVETESLAEAELLFTVPPRAFSPPPRVVSAVVRLRPIPAPVPETVMLRAFALAGAAFLHRRKQLPNALAARVPGARVAAALVEVGIGAGARAQDLSRDAWFALARVLPEGRAESP